MSLDCKKAVVVGMPQMAGGMSSPSPKTVSISDPMGETSSGPNKSAQFKNPRVKQDVPMEGRGQYEMY